MPWLLPAARSHGCSAALHAGRQFGVPRGHSLHALRHICACFVHRPGWPTALLRCALRLLLSTAVHQWWRVARVGKLRRPPVTTARRSSLSLHGRCQWCVARPQRCLALLPSCRVKKAEFELAQIEKKPVDEKKARESPTLRALAPSGTHLLDCAQLTSAHVSAAGSHAGLGA